jgi:hypothetical protein
MTAATAPSLRASPVDPGTAVEIERQLDLCQGLLDAYVAEAYRLYGGAALGVVDLPPLSGARIVGSHLGVAASLLWAREVEQAGLPGFVDALVLSRRMADGRVQLPRMVNYPFSGPAMERLRAYLQASRDRPDEATRRSFYDRVFGDPFSRDFEALIDTLSRFGREPATLRANTARIQATAEVVGELLTRRTQGAVQFATQQIIDAVRDGLRILRDPRVQQAMGRGLSPSPFALIRAHAPRVLGRTVDDRRHLGRAQAGAAVLSWLQGVATTLSSGGHLQMTRDANVVRAAERWRSLRDARTAVQEQDRAA